MASDTQTQETVQRFYEATGETFTNLLHEVLIDDVVLHDPHLEDIQGHDRVEHYYASFHNAFPNITFTVDDMFMADDLIAVRWTAEGTHEAAFWGIDSTGNEMHLSGIDIVQVTDGQISEVWTVYDSATLLQQLGIELPVTPLNGDA
ncbi:ester cyclase [Halorussus sp. AFM4]|uniref:ester cyclase n=1 Tax=Halorussus sp. AFM4 TaxID=3421651 RepID=UPI003EBEA5F2